MTHIRGFITILITTHEPPSKPACNTPSATSLGELPTLYKTGDPGHSPFPVALVLKPKTHEHLQCRNNGALKRLESVSQQDIAASMSL